VGVTGRLSLSDGLLKIGGMDLKLEPVRRGILNKLVVPTMNQTEVRVQTQTDEGV
jgi:ATP-dependent Lon protease